jgi:hypothetical protein
MTTRIDRQERQGRTEDRLKRIKKKEKNETRQIVIKSNENE